MATRVASSRLIGRHAELAQLEDALARAADGRPTLAFVAGDSGVGKTRLLDELMARAREQGAIVLAGESVDLGGEGELPYLPLIAALRPLARAGDPALTEPVRDAIAPLLPATSHARGDGDQARLLEGLLALLEALGRERPVLLVVEDLHWADRSTRAVLAFLARSLTDERLLVVASYRPDELLRDHPLRALLAELERVPHARRVALDPLSRGELAEQVADILGAPPDPELLDRLWTRSGGNPLFGEELLAAGLDGRGAAPRTLRDALMLRVEPLSEPARELLGLVAVGQRLDHELVEEASGLDPRTTRDALHEAVDHHLLAVDDDGLYRFRHALLREVVEDDLLPGERRELHRTLAHALEPRANASAQAAAAVAHHFDACGDEPAALAAAVRAGAAARRVYAHDEAIRLLERALDLWDRVPDAEARAGVDRVGVLTAAADSAGALGDPARQLALLEAALAALGPEPDPRRAAAILESVSRAQRHVNRARASIVALERGLAIVERAGDRGDASPRAALLAALGRVRMLAGHFDEAIRVGREALELATVERLAPIEGHARNTLGFSLALTGEVDAGLGQLREAIRIAHDHDNLHDLGEVYSNAAHALHALGRSDEARALAVEGRRAVVDRRPVAVTWLDTRLAQIAFDVGEWDVAQDSLPVPQPWTGNQTRAHVALRRALLALGRGELDTAAALVEDLEPVDPDAREPALFADLGVATAELCRRRGDRDGACAAVDRWLERLEDCADEATAVAAVASVGVSAAADAAQRARDLGDAKAAAAALDRIEGLRARLAVAATDTRPVERAAALGARAEATRAAGNADAEAYARAAAAWDELGRPEPAAHLRWREAEALALAGDRDGAAARARTAHAAAVRIGAGWLRGEIEALAARARLALEADGGEPQPHEDEDAFGLTARERQVLALLAEGATNSEIGATLFMARKTASVHVSRILSKLDARSRTEAAAIAQRHGLVE